MLKFCVDAIEKLEEALVIDPRKHDTLWCLGNAYTANAFLIPDIDEARPLFNKVAGNFNQAMVYSTTQDSLMSV